MRPVSMFLSRTQHSRNLIKPLLRNGWSFVSTVEFGSTCLENFGHAFCASIVVLIFVQSSECTSAVWAQNTVVLYTVGM